MNAHEAMLLCRYTKAACPQQAIDEFTPDVWLDILGDLRLEDAKAAVLAVAQTQPFVAPAEIRAEVRRVRSKRLAAAGDLTPPPDLTPLETQRWLRDARRSIADGNTVDCDAPYGELIARHLPDLRELLPAMPSADHQEAGNA